VRLGTRVVVALTLVAASGAIGCGGDDGEPGTTSNPYDVHLRAPGARVSTGAEVRIDGTRAGSVLDVGHTAQGTDLDLQVDDRYVPLHVGARAVLHRNFVEIILEPSGAPDIPYVPDGGTLPAR
jgi:ABC-type transporter Mla subunit MlaD